jgi:hypothetical protein
MDRTKQELLEHFQGDSEKADAVEIAKAKGFQARISQIFAEMLGSVCHTDNNYIVEGQYQTVTSTFNQS